MAARPELPSLSLREFGWWLLRRRRRLRVDEQSMLPLLAPGDEILVDTGAYRWESPQAGDLVVAVHPQRPLLQVKRVVELTEDGRLLLLGDNNAVSTDSRHYGPVAAANIIGRVTCRFG